MAAARGNRVGLCRGLRGPRAAFRCGDVGCRPQRAGPIDYLVGMVVYLVKLIVGGVLLGVFEVSIAKMRVFRVPNFLGAAFMLGLLGVLLLFVSRGM